MARTAWKDYLCEVWLAFNATSISEGMQLPGKLSLDATRLKASASGDLVISSEDYERLRLQFLEILERAATLDAQEEDEGKTAPSETGIDLSRIVVRRVVRSLGKALPEGELTLRGKQRIEECVQTLEEAKAQNLKHVSLSDPDSRMMPLGTHRAIGLGHALEVAVDSGVIVAGDACQEASDTGRLLPLTEAARLHSPSPIHEVKADSAYFHPDDIVHLQEHGIDVVVPDATTVHRMRNKSFVDPDEIRFEKIPGRDAYLCPNGHVLSFQREDGQRRQYRSNKLCTPCPLASKCLKKKEAKRRSLWVRAHHETIAAYLKKFKSPDWQRIYYARGPGVETVFAFIRNILGFDRWSVRGKSKVSAEAELLKCAYQLRKLHTWKLKTA